MVLLVAKALHIIFVVAWFAGLFYIVRLFVYHAEAGKRDDPDRTILQTQYKLMERRLWYIITWPSGVLAIISGLYLAFPYFINLFDHSWLVLKLAFVFALFLYHLQCGRIYRQFRNGDVKWSSIQLRLWNEVATVLLVAIVFVIVMKTTLSWIWGVAGLVLLGLLIMVVVRLYRKSRPE